MFSVKGGLFERSNLEAQFIEQNGVSYSTRWFNERFRFFCSELSSSEATFYVVVEAENTPDIYPLVCAIFATRKCFVPILKFAGIEYKEAYLKKFAFRFFFGNSDGSLEYSRVTSNECLSPVSGQPVNKVAYILSTSGSTGSPKLVPISYQNLECFLNGALLSHLKLLDRSRVTQFFELNFDVSIGILLLGMVSKSTLLIPGIDSPKYLQFVDTVSSACPSHIFTTPSNLLLAGRYLSGKSLSCASLVVTGEPSRREVLKIIRNVWGPDCKVINAYGPTETTIWATIHTSVSESEDIFGPTGYLCIGRPLPGVSTRRSEVPLGVEPDNKSLPGVSDYFELVLEGEQLSTGYLDQETEVGGFRAIKSPKGLATQSFVYHTGDIVTITTDEQLHYIGRLNNEVKVSGYRVNLDALENLVGSKLALPVIAGVVEDELGIKQILLVILNQWRKDEVCLKSEAKQVITERLPPYYIPRVIRVVPNWPLTSSGKVDRRRLLSEDVKE